MHVRGCRCPGCTGASSSQTGGGSTGVDPTRPVLRWWTLCGTRGWARSQTFTCTPTSPWMDSLDRTGAAIEIQSLRLNMYALAADFADDKKQEEYYLSLESKLKRDVKKLFFDGKNFGDRFDTDKDKLDLTIRPNIFLAAYIYPGLLSKKEWSVCFAVALEKLWLDWGGLSTIDKNDPRFCGRDTGENPAAYHNGDSWFWINNIAAIAMARVDKKKFKNHIEKIFEASKNDILWNGAIGCAGEISSAAMYESAGCPNQAWSNATFLELYRYVSGKF